MTHTFTFNMGSGWHLSINHDPNGKNKRQSKYPQPPNCSKLCFDDKNFIISYFKSTDVKAFPFENNIAMAHYTRMLLLLLLSRFSRVRLCAAPEMAAHQAPPSLGFSRQEHWSGLPFPSPGDLSCQELNPGLLHCRQILYQLSHQGAQSPS